MTDRPDALPAEPTSAPSIPEAAPAPEPRFDEPERPAPEVVDAPGRNTEF